MVECLLDVEKVSGSSPLSSTNKTKATNLGCFFVLLTDERAFTAIAKQSRCASCVSNLAKEKCFAFFVYLLNYHLLQVVD